MEVIEINSSNYKSYHDLNVVAFSLAHAGAQGESGGLKILDFNGILYHSNIVRSIKLEEAFSVCPPLKDCHFHPLNISVPKGWVSFYMGAGNFLVIKDKNEFKQSISDLTPNEKYWQWIDILQGLVKK